MRLARFFLPLVLAAVALIFPLLVSSYGSATHVFAAPEQQNTSRPVVMVHGFGSSATAWEAYLGADGFLAGIGREGFAVGDGQVEGTMNTGNLLDPTAPTNTIDQNARILGEYIAGVKARTGAEQVDLIAHSMGGLIARYYIDRVMEERDVAQLIMLGSPQGGTECANLPATAGLYLPAALEIRPSYVQGIFNRQITHRRGVPFSIVAGTAIHSPIQSPCASVPSDMVISLDSATGLPASIAELPLLHTDLNGSERVFQEQVRPLLERNLEELAAEEDVPADLVESNLEFTEVVAGELQPGEAQAHTINLDEVTVASFALFDPTQSLTVTVRGASGNVIELNTEANGLIVVDDPASLVHLGYGFENPRPGPWEVAVQTTDRTPAEGAAYAITARLEGGAQLEATSSSLLPESGEEVAISALLSHGDASLTFLEGYALVRAPDGGVEKILLEADEGVFKGVWGAHAPGVHGIDVTVRAETENGLRIDRSAFLAVDVQPDEGRGTLTLVLAVTSIVTAILALVLLRRRGKASARSTIPD